MTNPRHSNLHEFNLLLNASTAYAKVAQALKEHAKEGSWSSTAQELSKSIADAPAVVELPFNSADRHRHGNGHKPLFGSHPLSLAAKHFEALATAIDEISNESIESAAIALAKQLVVPFEKDGVAHLAFPHQGNGLKIRRVKAAPGIEALEWKSNWEDRAKIVLPKERGFENQHSRYNNRDPLEKLSPDEIAAIESVETYWARAPKGNPSASTGEIPTKGVHLAGTFTSSASSELPLASLSTDRSTHESSPSGYYDYSYATAMGLEAHEKFDPTQRRLGYGAVALLLGDKPSAADAASAHSSPCMKAEVALLYEAPGRIELTRDGQLPENFKVAFAGKNRALRPATCAMQLATSFASAENRSKNDYYSRNNAAESFPFKLNVSDSQAFPEHLKNAKTLLAALERKSSLIMLRSYALAKQAEQKWLADQGLSQALADAKLLGSGKVSIKSLNWALANPSAAATFRQAADNPELAFAAKCARFLGLRAEGDEQTIERAKAAWAPMGLRAEGYAGVANDPGCTQLLSELWSAKIEEKKRGKSPLRQERLELTCRAFQAAFESGSNAAQALAFAKWCAGPCENFFITDPAQVLPYAHDASQTWDRIHPCIPERSVSLSMDAKNVAEAAQARSAAIPDAMKAIFRAFAHGEDMPENCRGPQNNATREKTALFWLGMAAAGTDKAPALDWSKGLAGSSLRDMALRANGPLGQAMRQAAADGVHGAFAARAAIGLGIAEAVDANDLVAKTRDRLKADFEMSDSGWKALGKAPASMRDHLASQIEARIPDVLASRARFQKLSGASAQKTQDATGLGFALLTGAAHFGMALEDAALVEELGRQQSTGQRSELLRHGVRPIKVSSPESAQFALQEALAKAERLPRIAKSIAERFAKTRSELAAQGSDEPSARAHAKRQLSNDIALIDDWLKASEDGVWQTLPPKANFSDLMRRQATWHDDMAARVAAGQTTGTAAKAWPAPMSRHTDGEWTAVLLGTADELSEEGREMHHCVSSYSGYCKSGSSRIYSVRLNGERVSTLELKLTEEGSYKNYDHNHPSEADLWKKSQNNGKCNAAIKDPSALAFCDEVVAKMNAAHLAWTKELAAKRSLIAKQAAETRKNINVKIG